jgi:hypothetical protein
MNSRGFGEGGERMARVERAVENNPKLLSRLTLARVARVFLSRTYAYVRIHGPGSACERVRTRTRATRTHTRAPVPPPSSPLSARRGNAKDKFMAMVLGIALAILATVATVTLYSSAL